MSQSTASRFRLNLSSGAAMILNCLHLYLDSCVGRLACAVGQSRSTQDFPYQMAVSTTVLLSSVLKSSSASACSERLYFPGTWSMCRPCLRSYLYLRFQLQGSQRDFGPDGGCCAKRRHERRYNRQTGRTLFQCTVQCPHAGRY